MHIVYYGEGSGDATFGYVVKPSTVPIVGLDYFFITKEGVQRREEVALELGEEGEEENIAAAWRAGIITKCFLSHTGTGSSFESIMTSCPQ